jgi:hypothetical protein
MRVVGHQRIGVHRAAQAARKCPQVINVGALALLGEETHRAIVAALDDVPGNPRHAQAGTVRHLGNAQQFIVRPRYQKSVVCPLLFNFQKHRAPSVVYPIMVRALLISQ